MRLLEGKVAVITGAGNGIGQSVARLFAQHGAELVLSDHGTTVDGRGCDPGVVGGVASALRLEGATVIEHSADLSSREGVDSLFELARERSGRVDVLVNCAGILRERALLNAHDDELQAVLDLHVFGAFRAMRAAAASMREHGGGRIVNTTALSAFFGNVGQCANAAAASAIVGLTRSAAIDLGRHGITVNAVAPLAKTRQTANLPLFQHGSGMTPEHVAPAYLFCASDLAGDMTGEVVAMAGSRLSRLKMADAAGVFAESEDGIFDAASLAAAWQSLRE